MNIQQANVLFRVLILINAAVSKAGSGTAKSVKIPVRQSRAKICRTRQEYAALKTGINISADVMEAISGTERNV
jgi:hypothetical protein